MKDSISSLFKFIVALSHPMNLSHEYRIEKRLLLYKYDESFFAKQHLLYLDYVEKQWITDGSKPPFGFLTLLRLFTDPSTRDFRCNTFNRT